MTKRLQKFFIVCAIILGIGLLLLFIGFASGGVQSLNKVGEKVSWFRAGSSNMVSTEIGEQASGETFDALRVSGNVHVYIQPAASMSDGISAEISYAEQDDAPSYTIKDGVLTVNADNTRSGVYIDLTDGNDWPQVTVRVPADVSLKSISIETSAGDVRIGEIYAESIALEVDAGDVSLDHTTWHSMDIRGNSGDIDGYGVSSYDTSIRLESGDIDIFGEISGQTDIESGSGDVELDTVYAESLYSIDLAASAGEIESGNRESEFGGTLRYGSGNKGIKIRTSSGDISVDFSYNDAGHDNDYDDDYDDDDD